ncbi:hypothetical protein VKT23_013588 [Stygiomarasmius scandens]|uniref:Apoptosis inhibitor 5 n=1 Tax=Marasmiellus scandens TaxID=2682957 RepID=A0ABR1J807_9AGAR
MEGRINERDLQGIVRRAKTSPDKTGSLRRNALQQLIQATHSSSPQVKIYAANSIADFFQDFPDLEEDAINAVYDLCEDQVMQVRMEGYKTLAVLSKTEKKWVKRNADVLVQLLQTDEPNEVNVVKKALIEHLHMDPRITLGVLCDQLRPPEDTMDHEDAVHLRKLVINFLNGEAKKGSLQRIIAPGGESEQFLIENLTNAIHKLDSDDVEAIVKDILLHLPLSSQSSTHGPAFVQVILQRFRAALDTDSYRTKESITLDQTRPYFDMLTEIFVTRKLGSAEELLKFYWPLIGKANLQNIQADDRTLVIYHLAEAIAASPQGSATVRSIVGLSQPYFQFLADSDLAQECPIKASLLMLRSSLLLLEDGWQMPALVVNAIQGLGRAVALSKSPHNQDIQGLIRSIATKTQSNHVRKRASSSPNTSSSGVKSLPSRPPSATLPRRPLGPSESFTSLPGPSRATADTTRDSEDRPAKKARKSGEPSLLSRLSTAATKKAHTEKHGEAEVSSNELSIKGAASRNPHSEDQTSLMTRLNGSTPSEQVGRGRKRKKGLMQ